MRPLVVVSILVLGSLSIVACSEDATDPQTENGALLSSDSDAEASGSIISDPLGKALVGTWDRVGFISKRKEYPSIVFRENGAYDATRDDESREHGTFVASASRGTVLLRSAGGDRLFNAKIENGSELFMSLSGDPFESDDTEVFFRNPDAVDTDPDDPPGDGLDVACEERVGGAFITIETTGKPYTIWSTNRAFIALARAHLERGISKVAMFGKLTKGTDCDSGLKLIPDPNDMKWVDTAVEICDAEPEWLNDNIDYIVDTVGYWCPWHTVVVAVDER